MPVTFVPARVSRGLSGRVVFEEGHVMTRSCSVPSPTHDNSDARSWSCWGLEALVPNSSLMGTSVSDSRLGHSF